MIVIGIAHDARYFERFDQLDDLDVVGQHLAHGFADRAQALREEGPCDDVRELLQQHRAAIELQARMLVADRLQEPVRSTPPQQC